MALGATLKVRMDTSEVNRGLRGMKSKISRAFGTIKKVGMAAFGAIAAAGGALAALTINAAKFSTGVHTMSIQTGMTVHEVLALKNAFQMINVDADQASNLITEFKKRLAEARMGTGEAVIGLEALDMTIQDLAGMTTLQAFTKVMNGVQGVGAETDKAKLILDKFFGGAGMEHLSRLSSEFDELMAEGLRNTKNLSVEMKDASKFDAMNRGIARLSAFLRELQMRFISALPLDRFQKILDDADVEGFAKKFGEEMELFFKSPVATVMRWSLEVGMAMGKGIAKGIVGFLNSPEGRETLVKAVAAPIFLPFQVAGDVLRGGVKAHEEKTPAEKAKGGFNWKAMEDFLDFVEDIPDNFNKAFGLPRTTSGVGEELIRQGNESNNLLRRIEGAAPTYA